MKKRLCVAVWVNCLVLTVVAQKYHKTELTAELTSEGQYNLTNNKANWVNLLEVGVRANLGNNIDLIGDMITVQNTRLQKNREGGVCEDFQVFSNIEEDDLELNLFAFGPVWSITDRLNVFLGVRNVNMDYFSSPMTSLFTGSSQGIYPTVSANWEQIANYPLSGMCFHQEWNIAGNWEVKNSFYNGVASCNLTDVFRIRPHRDGIFNITQLGYVEPEEGRGQLGEYYAGFTYSNAPNEEGKKKKRTSVYGLIEQPLMRNIGLLLEGGWAAKAQLCRSYFGAALLYANLLKEDANLGVMFNRALYRRGDRETDVEVTYSIPLTGHIAVQPAMHIIRTSGISNTIGVIRVNITSF